MEHKVEKNINNKIDSMNPLVLAFIGDSVFDLYIKEKLVNNFNCTVETLHKKTVEAVRCETQANIFNNIIKFLTEDEIKIYKRARNCHINHKPKNATVAQYHTATGLEALIGYLYLNGNKERLEQLLQIIEEAY